MKNVKLVPYRMNKETKTRKAAFSSSCNTVTENSADRVMQTLSEPSERRGKPVIAHCYNERVYREYFSSLSTESWNTLIVI